MTDPAIIGSEERLQSATEQFEEQGYSERDSCRLAIQTVAEADDAAAQEAWEAKQ